MRGILILLLALASPLRAAELAETPEAAQPSAPLAAALPPAPDLAQLPQAAALSTQIPLAQGAPQAQAAPAREAPSARAVLSSVATAKDAAPAQAAAYDGLKTAPSPPTVDAPPPTSFLSRLNKATAPRSRAERWFERAVPLGITGATAAPVLWHAASPGTMLYAAPLALTAMTLIFGGKAAYRAARFIFLGRDARDGRPERSRLKAALAGAVLGVVLGAAPQVFQPQIVERGAAIATPAMRLRAVPGSALPDAVIAELSANPEGRDVLDGLRDRAGVVRLPRFYVGVTKGAVAAYKNSLDAVFIDADEVTGRGQSVDDFLRDPARQRAFARDFTTTFAHELRHGGQSRRSLTQVVSFSETRESEYEAFITEVRFTHARLTADPDASLSSSEMGQYLMALDGFDKFLKLIDMSYPDDHERTAYYRAYLARQRAWWPTLMVQGNLLLARRAHAQPKMAALYLAQARAAARQYGLPEPGRP